VQGNLIGTNATGTASIPNTRDGVQISCVIDPVTGNVIGGAIPAERNVISGNGINGIFIFPDIETTVEGTRIIGNYVGTDVTGTVALPNVSSGIAVSGTYPPASNIDIGGSAPGEGNLISGNRYGISLQSASAVSVQGNLIGTNATGSSALPNGSGVVIAESFGSITTDCTIGGTDPAASNLISGNEKYGVYISTGPGNQVLGNRIGTDASGSSPLGNGLYGVAFVGGSGNAVGGTAAGASNIIAHNGVAGVVVIEGATGDSIRGNAIFSNTGLGIELPEEGVNPNDAGDGDTGANLLQNFPVLASAATSGSEIVIEGNLNSTSGTAFALDFYASEACDPSGHGEGSMYLGEQAVTTDATGDGTFVANLTAAIPAGQFVTATATDPDGNTSEFSACVPVEQMNAAPVCTGAVPSADVLWPPDHRFVTINILGVTDPDGDVVAFTIDSIFQDEAVSVPDGGLTAPDGQGVGTGAAELRAERNPQGNGRVYHIGFTAADPHSGSCTGEIRVSVPRSQKPTDSALDGGALYDSTVPGVVSRSAFTGLGLDVHWWSFDQLVR